VAREALGLDLRRARGTGANGGFADSGTVPSSFLDTLEAVRANSHRAAGR
jgi:hypothetical protein